MEDDLLELRHALCERHLEVLLPEELGVGETRCDHPLVAGDDRLAAILASRFATRRSGWRDARRAAGRSISGAPSSRWRALRRQLQEGLIETSHQRHRPFGEPGILGEQRHPRPARAPLGRELLRALADDRLALAGIDDDVGGAQPLRIIVGARTAMVFGAMKRWPRVSLPLLMPSISNGTTLPPKSTGSNAADAPSAADRFPSASTSARGSRARSPARSRRGPRRARPGRSIGANRNRPSCRRGFDLLSDLSPGFEEALHRGAGADARALFLLAHVGERPAGPTSTVAARRHEARPYRSQPGALSRRRTAAPGPLRRASACAPESLRRAARAGTQP